jgi:hypothetical protein
MADATLPAAISLLRLDARVPEVIQEPLLPPMGQQPAAQQPPATQQPQ